MLFRMNSFVLVQSFYSVTSCLLGSERLQNMFILCSKVIHSSPPELSEGM